MLWKYIHAASVETPSSNCRKNRFEGKAERRAVVPKEPVSDMLYHVRLVERLKSNKAGGFSFHIGCVKPHAIGLIRVFGIKCRIECRVVRGIAAQCGKFLNVIFYFDFVPGTLEAS